jgi:uncharacterized protein YkuJ
MNYVREHKALAKLVKDHGMVMVRARKHYAIEKDGKFISSVSHSPKSSTFAREVIRELVNKGHLPAELKNVKI